MARPRKPAVTATTLDAREQLRENYRLAFGTASGQAVLDDLRKRFGRRGSFVPDSNVTAFHEGQRDVFRMIENFIEQDEAEPTPNEEEIQ